MVAQPASHKSAAQDRQVVDAGGGMARGAFSAGKVAWAEGGGTSSAVGDRIPDGKAVGGGADNKFRALACDLASDARGTPDSPPVGAPAG